MGERSRVVEAGVCVLLLSVYLAGYLVPAGVAALSGLARISAEDASHLSAYRTLEDERRYTQALMPGESVPSVVDLEPMRDNPRAEQRKLLVMR